ncbi:glycoside hydrolase family 130 protein [Stakelama tenebrarum]|uniref:Glycosidase n=1 Tax=Stakelama tenebrarum TaxID=2711215 RepID=A0A6G6Y1L8_9SPHN|nr:glycosidase [Sphingosinithalassobacter tenebrarum]QIG78834.1 glycosidase [Sphingosinithalassobacter tenebrarum]
MGDDDRLIFSPDDVDLARSPLRASLDVPTYVLGAFNPGLTRLPGGNLLMMVRVAEALCEPVAGNNALTIRWSERGYVLDRHPMADIEMDDPRQFALAGRRPPLLGLTSLSWLLPVELSGDARQVVRIHYDKAVAPSAPYMEYGLEDARISLVGGCWWMTVCAVSSQRHCTLLYRSVNGLDYEPLGIILDHQNKDMVFFEGKPGGAFMALTRPLGECYFLPAPDSPWAGGPAIQFATSPDGLHWKPSDAPGLRARKGSLSALRVGGGTQPVLTPQGWLMLYHGVERRDSVGVYRTFWALLDREDPTHILRQEDEVPLMEADPGLTAGISEQMYLPTPVVFTTGLADAGDHYVVVSGEADLACRMTRIAKERFA